MLPEDYLCIALDTSDAEEALRLVDSLKDLANTFKVGLQLYSSVGPSVIESIRERGVSVFLDLKLNDIPNTVAAATEVLSKYGVSFLTVHALAGEDAVRAAVDAAKTSPDPPKVIAVTLLTSLSEESLSKLGMMGSVDDIAVRLAETSIAVGADGVVSSGREIKTIKRVLPEDRLIITPGIRIGRIRDDQKRTVTPFEAVHAGADMLIVGRPITASPEPAVTAKEILLQIESALREY